MELREAIEQRYSCRKFKNRDIDDKIFSELIGLGNMAPSANNSKPWKFLVVKNRDVLQKMAGIVLEDLEKLFEDSDESGNVLKDRIRWHSTFFKDAPALIIVLSKDYDTPIDKVLSNEHKEDILKLRYHPEIQSLGACVQNILLGAQDMNLGACWLSGPVIASQRIAELLGEAGSEYFVAAMVAVGKPAVTKSRKANDEEIPVKFIY